MIKDFLRLWEALHKFKTDHAGEKKSHSKEIIACLNHKYTSLS